MYYHSCIIIIVFLNNIVFSCWNKFFRRLSKKKKKKKEELMVKSEFRFLSLYNFWIIYVPEEIFRFSNLAAVSYLRLKDNGKYLHIFHKAPFMLSCRWNIFSFDRLWIHNNILSPFYSKYSKFSCLRIFPSINFHLISKFS